MPRQAIMSDGDHIEFEVFGDEGPFVFLGPQFYLTPAMPEMAPVIQAYIDALSDRYRVILANWPRGLGNSSPARPSSLSCDNAINDIHAIADAAGADQFAWFGYSFGAAFGLQLARCNKRVSAFVCGGFPPLWQPNSDMLGVARRQVASQLKAPEAAVMDVDIARQGVAFYESIIDRDESQDLLDISCPRLVFHDEDDIFEGGGLKHDLSMRTRESEAELKELGWEIAWVKTGFGHLAPGNPQACLEAFAPFLDRNLLGRE